MTEPGNVCSGCGHENLPESQFCERCGTALLQLAPEQDPPAGLPVDASRYANFWERLAAGAIDLAVVAVFIFALTMIGNFLTSVAPNKPTFILTESGEPGQVTTEDLERLRQELGLGVPWYMRMRIVGALGIVAVGGIAAYFWLPTGIMGHTLGKLALRIQVVDSQGTVAGLGRAALRELLAKHGLCWMVIASLIFALWLAVAFLFAGAVPALALLPLIITAVGLLGFLWMAWDQRKQCWHDKFAGTYVVKKPKP